MNVDVNNVTLSSIDLDIGITPEMIARANEDHGPCFLSNNIGDGWHPTYSNIRIIEPVY